MNGKEQELINLCRRILVEVNVDLELHGSIHERKLEEWNHDLQSLTGLRYEDSTK